MLLAASRGAENDDTRARTKEGLDEVGEWVGHRERENEKVFKCRS